MLALNTDRDLIRSLAQCLVEGGPEARDIRASVSRTVAGHAAEQSGVDASVLKKMLPILAMLVAGYLAHQKGVGGGEAEGGTLGGGLGGLGSILGSVLGGGGQASAPASGGMLGQLGSLLDMDGDGNPLDDIMGMAGKFMK